MAHVPKGLLRPRRGRVAGSKNARGTTSSAVANSLDAAERQVGAARNATQVLTGEAKLFGQLLLRHPAQLAELRNSTPDAHYKRVFSASPSHCRQLTPVAQAAVSGTC